MINQPKFGTKEYYEWKSAEKEASTDEYNRHREFLELQQSHERTLKELELAQTRAEVGLQASVRILLQVPIVFLLIGPITLMVLFRRPIPQNIWKIMELN